MCSMWLIPAGVTLHGQHGQASATCPAGRTGAAQYSAAAAGTAPERAIPGGGLPRDRRAVL
eukprot:10686214-Lingulodinium_polyedra.AAC.1